MNKNWFKDNLNFVLKIFLSLSIFIYLICVVTGNIDKNDRHLKTTDLGLIGVLLLVNSDLLERLQKLQFSKEGLDLELESKLKANLNVNQKETTALTYLGGILLKEDKYKEEQRYFFDILLNDGDRDLLEDFYAAENKNKKLLYNKAKMFDHLLHLHLLSFIHPIFHYTKCPIEDLVQGDDLMEHFYLTDEGKKCLKLGSSRTINSSDIIYDSQLKPDRENMSSIINHN